MENLNKCNFCKQKSFIWSLRCIYSANHFFILGFKFPICKIKARYWLDNFHLSLQTLSSSPSSYCMPKGAVSTGPPVVSDWVKGRKWQEIQGWRKRLKFVFLSPSHLPLPQATDKQWLCSSIWAYHSPTLCLCYCYDSLSILVTIFSPYLFRPRGDSCTLLLVSMCFLIAD